MALTLTGSAPVTVELPRLILADLTPVIERLLDLESPRLSAATRDHHVHETRKAMKSLRAILRLLRPTLGAERFRREDRCFRDVARALAPARDVAATRLALAALASDEAAAGSAVDWAPALAHVTTILTRGDGHASPPAVVIGELRAALRAARTRIDAWSFQAAGWDALGEGLERTYARGRHGYRCVRQAPTTERLHDWRKAVKYQRDQIRCLRPLWAAAMNAHQEALDELGELLGQDHDLALLEGCFGPDATRAPTSSDPGWLAAMARRRGERQRAALILGERLFVERPRHFGRRMAAYYRAWVREASGPDRPGTVD